MKYTKPPLSFKEQSDLLLSRGMIGDPAIIIDCLSSVSYYRLSGYWFHRKLPDNSFKTGTTFNVVWEQYRFDRALRLLVMDAVERVEVALRTQISFTHSQFYQDPFAYALNPVSLPFLGSDERTTFLNKIKDEIYRSRERFIDHFEKKYGDCHSCPPLWMASETMSFGSILKLYKGSDEVIRNNIAKFFQVPEEVLWSWLLALNTVRNICAHHGRLWNRPLGTKPKIPKVKMYPDWHHPVEITGDRLFGILAICGYCINRLAPKSQWFLRLQKLLEKYPRIPTRNMGFPEHWIDSPVWGMQKRER